MEKIKTIKCYDTDVRYPVGDIDHDIAVLRCVTIFLREVNDSLNDDCAVRDVLMQIEGELHDTLWKMETDW